jgi:phage gpG-like protein
MTGVAIQFEVAGLDAALARLNRAGSMEFQELLDGLSRMGQQQTQRRIEEEKTSPAGRAWPKTTDGRAALFVSGAHLSRSIDHAATATEARWGSGWIGARVHQFGAVITPKNAKALRFKIGGKSVVTQRALIPPRPYLGVSEDNRQDLEKTAITFVERYFQ